MTYSAYYKSILAGARTFINVKLTDYADFLNMCASADYHCSWAYISVTANALTAYNELSSNEQFFKIRNFIPYQ